ncbi:MAG: hypothetical protein K8L97_23465 [Anaerolineae bacterium]|nr:hypothetical protein [Anaerolineae bacterium]
MRFKAFSWYQAPGELQGYVVNLLESDPAIALADPYKVNDDVLASIIDIIYEKMERIDALVKGRKFSELDINDFMFARRPETCTFCNWKSMCVEMSHESPAKFLSYHKPAETQLKLQLD